MKTIDPMTTPNYSGDYVDWIKKAFNERCRNNPLYSLRAFARDLKLSPATISNIMNGRKSLSVFNAKKVAKIIGLNEQETEIFCHLVQLKGRSSATRMIAQAKLAQLQYHPDAISLQMDAFQVIAGWYHLAILQLVQLKNFEANPKWMAAHLGVHSSEVLAAIERLERLELLVYDNGHYRVAKEMVFSPDGIPSDAIRKFHNQILERASAAITSQTVEERCLHTAILPIRLEDLPRAKEKIRNFNREFDLEFSPKAPERGDQVYALSVQLFSLTPLLNKPNIQKESES